MTDYRRLPAIESARNEGLLPSRVIRGTDIATVANVDVGFKKDEKRATGVYVVKGIRGEAIGCLAENKKTHCVQDFYVRYRQKKIGEEKARLLNVLVRLAEPAVGNGNVSLNVFTVGNVTYEPLPVISRW